MAQGAIESLAPRLRRNEATFHELIRLAEVRLATGRLQSAVEWCRVAAAFAMTNPMRALRSPELEDCLDRIALAALDPGVVAARERSVSRVLHVITEAATVGGLTRAVERWIGADTAYRSSVAVTRQADVIEGLALACEASGGRAVALGPDLGDTIARAAHLRQLAGEVDLIICHLQSDDVVTALAFGAGYCGPPVAVFNHADHLFWLAPTRANMVIDARDVGVVLTSEARGYRPATSHRLLMPVPVPSARLPRPAARAELGWSLDETVAITVARPVKYRDTLISPTFAQIARSILDSNPGLVLCAVGPSVRDDPWPGLIHDYPGRVRAIGPVEDPQPYLDAADLYIDTFPFSSSTSLLEAMAASLPAITLDAHSGFTRALGVADLVAGDLDRPCDLAGFQSQIELLVGDPDERQRRGLCALRVFNEHAQVASWPQRIGDLYEHLSELGRADVQLGGTRPGEADRRLTEYAIALLAVELNTPLSWVISASWDRFDAQDRKCLRRRAPLKRVAGRIANGLHRDPWRADLLLLGGLRTALSPRPLGVENVPQSEFLDLAPRGEER